MRKESDINEIPERVTFEEWFEENECRLIFKERRDAEDAFHANSEYCDYLERRNEFLEKENQAYRDIGIF